MSYQDVPLSYLASLPNLNFSYVGYLSFLLLLLLHSRLND